MRKLLVAVVLASLACCGPTAEEQRSLDARKCSDYGMTPGTEGFANCMMKVSQQREANEAADRRAAAARADADQRARDAQAASDKAAPEKDAETQRNIKQGEDLENRDARQAGFGPSATDGMNCATNTSSTGSANNLATSTSTTCH